MKIKAWILSIGLVSSVIAGLGFVKYSQVMAAIAFGESFPEPSASVQSTIVQVSQYRPISKVVGQLQSPKHLVVSNEYAGPITYVGFAPGDYVQAGEVLIEQDVALEKAELSAAQSRLRLAQVTLSRRVSLLKQNRASQGEVDEAEANVAVAQAEVSRLATIISRKTITAPFAGQVGLEQYQTGQLLAANTSLTTLVGQGDKIWVDFSIPQTQIQIATGDTVMIHSAVANSQPISAKVMAREASVNANSRQLRYRAELDNTSNTLSHNQMVTVHVPGPAKQVVLVPVSAITRNHFGEFVYQLQKDAQQNWRAKPIKVELGPRQGEQQIVLSGLTGGEFIAAQGAFKLSEGLLVYTEQANSSTVTAGSL
ncbi:efflux RND transporter periplasmic adaptor subunit [Planctobacterium marinum]|uniref:MexH family multidrug efflux RND transporter periplasmic adaptor subunit n=1 Tax=Planctobacterium marinum TaxID=1631968 RepID=A0AA48HGC5_9ALTE|nr:MexH family multidrug efflux RND transporter periplasmic adaptor subunit [Planctobacterium marinum]